jgi:hypothetical protein
VVAIITHSMKSLIRRLSRGRPIVVVSGLPRSGTSLAMNMLQAGGMPIVTDGRRPADQSNPEGYFELELVKTLPEDGGAAWLPEARGRAVKVVSPLLTYLPETFDYRVIFMRRELDEVIASQNAMLDARGQPRGAADNRMRAHYEEHLRQVDRFLHSRSCFTILSVPYAAVVTQPRQQAEQMATFLGRALDVAQMAAVVDAALYRHRQRGEDVVEPRSADNS